MQEQKNPRIKTKLFAFLLLGLFAGSMGWSLLSPSQAPATTTLTQTSTTTETSSTTISASSILDQATVSLWINVYAPNGSLVGHVAQPDDLILDNFNYYLLEMLGQGPSSAGCSSLSGARQYGCNAIGNTYSSCPAAGCGVELGIGTGASAAARTDTALQSIYGSLFADTGTNSGSPTTTPDGSLCTPGSTSVVYDINGSTTAGSNAEIKEAGAFLVGYNEPESSIETYMIFHDTFSEVAVTTGDTIDVSYQVNLANAGFNENLCQLLAVILTGNMATNAVSNVILGNSVQGEAGELEVWCAGGGNALVYNTSPGCSVSYQEAYMAIGTGSSSFSYSSTTLTAMVGNYQYLVTRSYTSTLATATLYWTTNFNLHTSNDIKEAGMFMYVEVGPENLPLDFMMFALTFGGQSQVAGNPFGVSLWVTD